MLHEFITTYRDDIIARTRDRLAARPWPSASADELENGVPHFLTQLAETLKWEATTTPFSTTAIGSSAARHGGELLALGFSASQVVHDYGDICQAITELALEHHAAIRTEEFHTLNRCLDTAIAEAVTEHGRLAAAARSASELERLGQVAHELRNMLNTAILAFHAVQKGTVPINGSTGTVLGRSLMGLRQFIDATLSDVRIAANQQRQDRIVVTPFLHDIATAAGLDAVYRDIQLAVDIVPHEAVVHGDPQLLASAIMNLLNNAFKFTPPGGRVVLRAHEAGRLLKIEVEDQCGGIPPASGDLFQPFGERRCADRTGLGLGLSIARKAVRAHGGDIEVRNIPGHGCVFTIEIPLSPAAVMA